MMIRRSEKKSWRILDADPGLVETIRSRSGMTSAVSAVLVNRGITSAADVDDFLNPSLSKLPQPGAMADLSKGAGRIVKALASGEHVAVYGDYDADGITACALMVMVLREMGGNVSYYLPDRFEEGYSLNEKALADLKERGVSVVVTVDCGVSDFEHVAYGRSLGLDIVITDHHTPPAQLPDANAVINPKRKDCDFPFRELAGVGVAFYFLIELRTQLREAGYFNNRQEPNLKEYLDLVAIGTVADLVPLTGPNRIFVKYGLDEIRNSTKEGVISLRSIVNIDDLAATRSISHYMAPRINAPGRMSSPMHSLELLLSMDKQGAAELMKVVNKENQRRQQESERIFQEAVRMIDSMDARLCYVLYSPDWHPGVIGIVASKLLERFNRPFFILTDERGGLLRGSSRSVEGFPIVSLLESLSGMLVEFGGHALAAGFSIEKARLDEFAEALENAAREFLDEKTLCRYYQIDGILESSEIGDKLFAELNMLEPFGNGNPEPIFVVKDVVVQSVRAVGQKENHLKLNVRKDGTLIPCIGFYMFDRDIRENMHLDIIGLPRQKEYNGIRGWDFHIRDIAIHD